MQFNDDNPPLSPYLALFGAILAVSTSSIFIRFGGHVKLVEGGETGPTDAIDHVAHARGEQVGLCRWGHGIDGR